MESFFYFVLICLIHFHSSNGAISKEDFYPYGNETGDLTVTNGVDHNITARFSNNRTFSFFSESYDELFISTNAAITFKTANLVFTPNCGSLTQPMILPYWADINTALGGVVYYRETDDEVLLAKAKADVNLIYPDHNLKLDWIFVITWDEVAFFGAEAPSADCVGRNKRNMYQAILATAGSQSFAIFNYNKITWTTGTMSGGDNCTGLGGSRAKAGFDFGDQKTFYEIASSCKAEVINITETTNVDLPGKWVFKIDNKSELPITTTEVPTIKTTTAAQTTKISTETAETTTTEGLKTTSTVDSKTTTTTEIPKPCDVDCSTGKIYHPDPKSCHSFYQCSNGVPYFQPCPAGLVFNSNLNICDWPQAYQCVEPPGCFREN